MIATLTGKVAEKLSELVVIDVNGIGYGIFVTVEDYGKLHVGKPAKVYVYEHIREASHDLFGFISSETKYLFEQLLGVNGVGPKMALNMLSIGSGTEVRTAIAGGDVKFIQSANGVGKKVAERVIVDLKDKVGLTHSNTDALLASSVNVQKDEAVQALMALGFSLQDAVAALNKVSIDLPAEQRVKEALKLGT